MPGIGQESGKSAMLTVLVMQRVRHDQLMFGIVLDQSPA